MANVTEGEAAILQAVGYVAEKLSRKEEPPLLTLGTLNKQGELLDVYGKGQEYKTGGIAGRIHDDVASYYSSGQPGRILTGRESESNTHVGIVPHAAPVDATSFLYPISLPIQFIEELYDLVNPPHPRMDPKRRKEWEAFEKWLNPKVNKALNNAWNLELKYRNNRSQGGNTGPTVPPSPQPPSPTVPGRGASSFYLGITDSSRTNCDNFTFNYNNYNNQDFINFLRDNAESSRKDTVKAYNSHIRTLRADKRHLEEEKRMSKLGDILKEAEYRKHIAGLEGVQAISDISMIGKGKRGSSYWPTRAAVEKTLKNINFEQSIGYANLLGLPSSQLQKLYKENKKPNTTKKK